MSLQVVKLMRIWNKVEKGVEMSFHVAGGGVWFRKESFKEAS